jgi:hypothetical protein
MLTAALCLLSLTLDLSEYDDCSQSIRPEAILMKHVLSLNGPSTSVTLLRIAAATRNSDGSGDTFLSHGGA